MNNNDDNEVSHSSKEIFDIIDGRLDSVKDHINSLEGAFNKLNVVLVIFAISLLIKALLILF